MRHYDKNKEFDIIRKWSPIIDRFKICGKQRLIDISCLYCEWLASDSIINSTITKELTELKENIDRIPRIKIVGKAFNPVSGVVEYELENGEYIPINKSADTILTDEQLISIFDFDFLTYMDPRFLSIRREIKLDNILK